MLALREMPVVVGERPCVATGSTLPTTMRIGVEVVPAQRVPSNAVCLLGVECCEGATTKSVLSTGNQFEVAQANAASVKAGPTSGAHDDVSGMAQMIELIPRRDRAARQQPSAIMGGFRRLPSLDAELAVTILRERRHPNVTRLKFRPSYGAGAVLVDLLPKSVLSWPWFLSPRVDDQWIPVTVPAEVVHVAPLPTPSRSLASLDGADTLCHAASCHVGGGRAPGTFTRRPAHSFYREG
jgi:hypothetical protein